MLFGLREIVNPAVPLFFLVFFLAFFFNTGASSVVDGGGGAKTGFWACFGGFGVARHMVRCIVVR